MPKGREMVLSETNEHKLALLRDIYEVSCLCGARTYIWAGLVQDVFAGQFLREHGDVDGFTLNLWELRADLAALYRQKGYEVSFLEDVNFLRIDRDGAHATFNRLEIDGDTAMWRHAGNEGTVYFPRRWLADEPRRFYDAHVFVSGIEFEYAIKTHPHLLSPLWHGREKDMQTIAWLSKMLAEKQLDPADVCKQVWSYNPYWVKKGYQEYAMPSVAWRLEPR
jgi:hypothetical protein